MLPKVYGDKLQHAGADGTSPVSFVIYGPKEAASTDEWVKACGPSHAGSDEA